MRRHFLLLLMLLSGCSSTGGQTRGLDLASPAGAGDLAGATAHDLGSERPDLAGLAGHDLGGGGAGGGGGGGGTRLYPLAVGNRWTYTVTQVGNGSVCGAGSFDQSIVSAHPAADGRAAFQSSSFCTGVAGTQDVSTPGGDEVDAYYGGAWAPFIAPPLMAGYTWSYFNASYTWQREGTITVPAGSYSDCWTAKQNVTYTAYITYCRGAGMVRSYSADLSGSGWDAQLAAKNF